ncbi:hypothetical protein AAIM60_13260 [Pseudomonas lijiangensis]|uniref:hypothetical protein n=1 Tax=Pseudomonas lijiangensis TaxID=2995658 RepID=UPI0031BB463E
MELNPFPCFFNLKDIQALNPDDLARESPELLHCLESCAPQSEPLESYSLVKGYLLAHAVPTRYNLYRASIERLLLWCLLILGKPIKDLCQADIRRFMDFCLLPPAHWVASRPEKRLRQISTHRVNKKFIINSSWRPFRPPTGLSSEAPKGAQKISCADTLAGCLAVVNSFYLYLCFQEILNTNPAAALHDAKLYSSPSIIHDGSRHFSNTEWDTFVSTAEKIAKADPEFGRDDDTYGVRIAGYPNLESINIPSEYVTRWVMRFRTHMGTHSKALNGDRTPLISTKSGRVGISRRHANVIFKMVCDAVVAEIESSGMIVAQDSPFRVATLLWLSETRLVQSAQSMTFEELYPSIRGTTTDTFYNRYFAWQYDSLVKRY